MNNLPAMHFPHGPRENNFDSQIKIIYSWSKRIPFASSGPFCACIKFPLPIYLYQSIIIPEFMKITPEIPRRKIRVTQIHTASGVYKRKTAANCFSRMLSQREEHHIEFFFIIKHFLIKKLIICILKI